MSVDQRKGIYPIVKEELQKQRSNSSNGGGPYEFLLDQLPAKIARELQKYVESCIKSNKKKEQRRLNDQARR